MQRLPPGNADEDDTYDDDGGGTDPGPDDDDACDSDDVHGDGVLRRPMMKISWTCNWC